MTEICRGKDNWYRRVAEEQGAIGWRRFMEGMICRGLRGLQELYTTVKGSNVSGEQWATGVVIKLLETTHGQWLYRCIQVHDVQAPVHARDTRRLAGVSRPASHGAGGGTEGLHHPGPGASVGGAGVDRDWESIDHREREPECA